MSLWPCSIGNRSACSGDEPGDHLPAFAEQAEEELASRREQVPRREEKAVVVEGRLRAWDELSALGRLSSS